MPRCISCEEDKEPKEFGLRQDRHNRKTVCRKCTSERLVEENFNKMLKIRDDKIRILTNIQRDTVKAYTEKNPKSLRLCVERMIVENKSVHLKKQEDSNDEL